MTLTPLNIVQETLSHKMSAGQDKGEGVTKYSDWMSQLPSERHNIPLYDLAIPGSHDSMSYDLDISSSIIEPDRLKRFSKIYCARKIVRKWAVTQEEPIAKQLDAGVRYFDLRIARKPNDTDPNRFYFYHGLYTRTDVQTVLRLINDWAASHPKEILILAFSHFKGFDVNTSEQLHISLIDLIRSVLGSRLLCRTWTPTLRSCWDQDKNIIASYDYPANQFPEIWSKIPYYYGDSMEPAQVESKLRQVLGKGRPSHGFFVCGLNLTLPEDSRILFYVLRPCDRLASVIQRSLPRLLQCVRQQAAKSAPNIIASDVVTRGNFISTIVHLNISK